METEKKVGGGTVFQRLGAAGFLILTGILFQLTINYAWAHDDNGAFSCFAGTAICLSVGMSLLFGDL